MKVLAVSVFNCSEEGCFRLLASYAVEKFNFFIRKSVREHMAFASRTVMARTQPGSRIVVSMEKDDIPFRIHVQTSKDGLGVVVITDDEYPELAAFQYVLKTEKNFHEAVRSNWGAVKKDQNLEPAWLAQSLKQWQDPNSPDVSKLASVQMKAEHVKGIMHKNIEEILKNGEALDEMVIKSDELSSQAKIFFKQGKKARKKCCR